MAHLDRMVLGELVPQSSSALEGSCQLALQPAICCLCFSSCLVGLGELLCQVGCLALGRCRLALQPGVSCLSSLGCCMGLGNLLPEARCVQLRGRQASLQARRPVGVKLGMKCPCTASLRALPSLL